MISFFMTPFILLNSVIQYLSYRPHSGPRAAGMAAAVAGPGVPPPLAGQKKGLAIASVVLGVVACAAGEDAFRTANQKIFAFHNQVAFGNTPEAQAMAARFSEILQSMVAIGFTGGRKDGPSLSEGRFLTYCEVRNDRICFLVHVPELRNYKGEVRDALLKLSWLTAQQVTKERRKDHDVKVAIGLRGALSYGAVAVGMGEAEPRKTMAEVLDEKSLFEFFVDAQPQPPAAR